MWLTRVLIVPLMAVVMPQLAFGAEDPGAIFASFKELESPAGEGAREPSLFVAADGRTYLSWLEPVAGDRFAVRFSIAEAEQWSPARTITSDDALFVNWADFPSIVAFADGRLAAHWLRTNSEKSYTYDVVVATSDAGGTTWSAPVVPHRDRTPTQHGFASLLPLPGGGLGIAWLDGRSYTATGAFAAADEASSTSWPCATPPSAPMASCPMKRSWTSGPAPAVRPRRPSPATARCLPTATARRRRSATSGWPVSKDQAGGRHRFSSTGTAGRSGAAP